MSNSSIMNQFYILNITLGHVTPEKHCETCYCIWVEENCKTFDIERNFP